MALPLGPAVRSFEGGDAESSKVKINLSISPNLPSLRADRNYLKQLLLNLILNGIQAMPEGGKLTVQASTSRHNLNLTIRDEGVGIDPDNISRIFEPYFTSKANGSGLGLSIARRIVEAHDGNLSVTSEVGQGSSFHVTLPISGVKPISLHDSPLGFLKIGLSLEPMEAAWKNSLWSIIILGSAILGVGILGMAAIFYNQHSHLQQIKNLETEVGVLHIRTPHSLANRNATTLC